MRFMWRVAPVSQPHTEKYPPKTVTLQRPHDQPENPKKLMKAHMRDACPNDNIAGKEDRVNAYCDIAGSHVPACAAQGTLCRHVPHLVNEMYGAVHSTHDLSPSATGKGVEKSKYAVGSFSSAEVLLKSPIAAGVSTLEVGPSIVDGAAYSNLLGPSL